MKEVCSKWYGDVLRILLTLSIMAVYSAVAAAQSLQVDSVWQGGLALPGDRVGYSSPAVADLDNNPANGLETVAASINGTIHAYRADGTVLWTASSPDSGCGAPAKIHSSPAVGPLYGDGLQYVVIGYGSFEKRCNGGVIALRGTDGVLMWDFSTKIFSKKQKFWAVLHAVFGAPGLADTDGDGRMEVGFGSFDRNVYLLNYNGAIRWYYTAADTVWSSPVFANLNKDRNLEMIIGTDISQNKKIKPVTANGGNLYAFKTQKNKNKKYNFRDKKAFLWMKPVEQVLFSNPAVGDVDPENPGAEIVINSGCYFPERTDQKVGKWVRVFSGSTGKLLRTLPIEACSPSSPALGDIDGDGISEIAVTVNGDRSIGGDGASRIAVFKATSPIPLWSIIPTFRGRNYSLGGNFISPVIADVNRDGLFEVIAGVASGVGIYDARTGTALSCQASPCGDAPSLSTGDILLNTPIVTDLDGDGTIDIIAAGKHSSGGAGLYRWSVTPSGVADISTSIPWGMFKRNAARAG